MSQDNQGNTVLMVAAKNGEVDVFTSVLSATRDVLDQEQVGNKRFEGAVETLRQDLNV